MLFWVFDSGFMHMHPLPIEPKISAMFWDPSTFSSEKQARFHIELHRYVSFEKLQYVLQATQIYFHARPITTFLKIAFLSTGTTFCPNPKKVCLLQLLNRPWFWSVNLQGGRSSVHLLGYQNSNNQQSIVSQINRGRRRLIYIVPLCFYQNALK